MKQLRECVWEYSQYHALTGSFIDDVLNVTVSPIHAYTLKSVTTGGLEFLPLDWGFYDAVNLRFQGHVD